jgi:hypothetical protein
MLMNELFDKYDAECIPELQPRSQRDYRGILVKLRETFGHLTPQEVKPRQPKDANWYLVTVPSTRNTSRHVTLAWWEPGCGWETPCNCPDNGHKLPRPTHYMPLPKPARRSARSGEVKP